MAGQRLSGKRFLLVIAPEQFRDEELLKPKQIFEEEGATTTITSCSTGPAKGMLGATINPDLLLSKVTIHNYDAILVVGGMGSPAYLWHDTILHGLLQQAHTNHKVVAGICLSGAVLAKAGILKGKKATVWATPESLQALKDGGASYIKEHVVQDGSVITADGPEAASAFAKTIVNAVLSLPSPAP